MSWVRGRDEILGMLERAELTRVVADVGLAERLIALAKRHLTSAEQLSDKDPELAYAGSSMGKLLRPVDHSHHPSPS